MRKAGGGDRDRDGRRSSLERYLLMNERQKDAEIQKAIVRLQKRIQEILYLVETGTPHIPDSAFDATNKRKND